MLQPYKSVHKPAQSGLAGGQAWLASRRDFARDKLYKRTQEGAASELYDDINHSPVISPRRAGYMAHGRASLDIMPF